MKKSASTGRSQDHVKPFIVAIGIAFTFLAVVVIYIAFMKGGLDIRSRAGSNPNQKYDCVPAKLQQSIIDGSTIETMQCESGRELNISKKTCCKWVRVIPSSVKPTMSWKMTSTTYAPTQKKAAIVPTRVPTRVPTKKLRSCISAGSRCSATTKCCGVCVNGKCR